MITKHDIPPGSLVRFNAEARARYARSGHRCNGTRAVGVGLLIGFDHFGRKNPDKGDPLILWSGEKKPELMAGCSLEIVP
mgnify:CR=1 FL=1|jgi:hypothetical protein|tara:strand:- start:18039 stop:18278 length:240 start_codon:yes stop_codon:yes gene_type:complete